jgi:hypothetical protein
MHGPCLAAGSFFGAGRPPLGTCHTQERRVRKDCAVDVDGNAYSAPWRLIGERVEAIVAAGLVRVRAWSQGSRRHKLAEGRRQRNPRERLRRPRRFALLYRFSAGAAWSSVASPLYRGGSFVRQDGKLRVFVLALHMVGRLGSCNGNAWVNWAMTVQDCRLERGFFTYTERLFLVHLLAISEPGATCPS